MHYYITSNILVVTNIKPNGYLVDQKGNIELPRIGVIHVEGVTKDSLAAENKNKIENPTCRSNCSNRFTNFPDNCHREKWVHQVVNL
jgi:protein involved in polysaccharide export with SLBB domain